MSLHYTFELEVSPQGISPIIKRILFDPAFVLVNSVGYENLEDITRVQVKDAHQALEVLSGFLRDFGNCSFQVIEPISRREVSVDADEKSFGFMINARLGWTEGDCVRIIKSWTAEFFDRSKLRLEYF